MTAPKPMDPERLVLVRSFLAALDGWSLPGFEGESEVSALVELLADRDWQAAERMRTERNLAMLSVRSDLTGLCAALHDENTRLRARVRVEARDVPELQPDQIIGYLETVGWSEAHVVSRDGDPLWTVMIKGDRGLDVPMMPSAIDYRRIVADIVNELGTKEGRAALDILDEMAAMPTPDHSPAGAMIEQSITDFLRMAASFRRLAASHTRMQRAGGMTVVLGTPEPTEDEAKADALEWAADLVERDAHGEWMMRTRDDLLLGAT